MKKSQEEHWKESGDLQEDAPKEKLRDNIWDTSWAEKSFENYFGQNAEGTIIKIPQGTLGTIPVKPLEEILEYQLINNL